MPQSQMQADYSSLRDQITDLKKDVERIRGGMVTKSEFSQMARRVDRNDARITENESITATHDEAYMDYLKGKKWVARIGIATLVSAWLSPHVKSIAEAIKFVAEMGLAK